MQYEMGREWVATIGYQGSQTRRLTRQYNLNLTYAVQGIPFNPVVNGVDWYANDGNASFNAMLLGSLAPVQSRVRGHRSIWVGGAGSRLQ